MTIIHAIILGIVQGLTEFLPISSSGHLILVPYILGWNIQSVSFDLALHAGTACAVVVYFLTDWVRMTKSLIRDVFSTLRKREVSLKNLTPPSKMLLLIVGACAPVGIVGILLETKVETLFRSPIVVAVMMIGISAVLFIADRYHDSRARHENFSEASPTRRTLYDVVLISLSQIIALVPGTSRSGISMSTGMFRGYDRASAARISFLLATPLILGAALAHVDGFLSLPNGELPVFLIGTITSFLVGLWAISFLLRFLKTHRFTVFIIYRVVVACIILAVALL